MPESSEKCIWLQNSTSVLAFDLMLPGAMKNNLESEDLRLDTFLHQLEEPGLFSLCQRRTLGKGKTLPEDSFGNLLRIAGCFP